MAAEPPAGHEIPKALKPVAPVHTSVLLRQLVDSARDEHFTLEWLISHLPKHSFGVILLFLALLSILPVISVVAQLLISLLAIQIILGYHNPVLPKWLTQRPLPSRYLARLNRYAIPALQKLERAVRPRWSSGLYLMRRPTAFVALVLTLLSIVTPVPMANVPPAVISVLMALAYIEHDGLMLSVSVVLALSLLGGVGYCLI